MLVEEIHGRIINHHGKETIIASLTGSITECDIDIMRQLKAEIDLAEQHKQECMDKMLAICENEYSTQLHNLQTIPGVKMRAATSLIAEIGTDMSHFETANHLASWSGLKPRNDQSTKLLNHAASLMGTDTFDEPSYNAHGVQVAPRIVFLADSPTTRHKSERKTE